MSCTHLVQLAVTIFVADLTISENWVCKHLLAHSVQALIRFLAHCWCSRAANLKNKFYRGICTGCTVVSKIFAHSIFIIATHIYSRLPSLAFSSKSIVAFYASLVESQGFTNLLLRLVLLSSTRSSTATETRTTIYIRTLIVDWLAAAVEAVISFLAFYTLTFPKASR
jgi:hypothetical protein